MDLGGFVSLRDFAEGLRGDVLHVAGDVHAGLHATRKVVDAATAGEAPVYGLNTGLGANLSHRIAPGDIAAFQHQLIAGRAVAVGPMLPPPTGRAVLLARLIGAARGHSGMSPVLFDHLCDVFRAGLSPGIAGTGSIGAADLAQNAHWALALLGQGQMWNGTAWQDSDAALAQAGLVAPVLQPKDAMALINHSAVSVAGAAAALGAARVGLSMCQHAAVLSFEGYGANPQIFNPEINALRAAPGQAEMAAWFLDQIGDSVSAPRVQDALSFRTLAPVMGAAQDAISRAIAIWEDELNGASDSPAVLGSDAMCSTPNFHAPALALALEQVSLAMAMVGNGVVMRVQRLMNPALTGLPRYLSPVGGASAGFVPLQKTAAALLAEVRRHAMPVSFDPAPVSDGVEDMAPMTGLAASKLSDQMQPLHVLAAVEAVVAAQARDLRGLAPTPLHQALRSRVLPLQEDRALGQDVDAASAVLRIWVAEKSEN